MKVSDYNGSYTVEQATRKRLDRTDYYSRGSEAVAEKVQNLIDLNTVLVRILVDKRVLDVEAVQELLSMTVEE